MRLVAYTLASRMLACCAMGVAGMALAGQLFEVSLLSNWGGETSMAVPTAIGMLLNGAAIICVTLSRGELIHTHERILKDVPKPVPMQ